MSTKKKRTDDFVPFKPNCLTVSTKEIDNLLGVAREEVLENIMKDLYAIDSILCNMSKLNRI